MTDDAERFSRLMTAADHPMVIVTTASADVRAGCLVGFHAQAGISPLEYAIWLSKANHTYRVGALAERFAVHLPRRDDRDLAELFGGSSGDDVDKFASCRWSEGPGGVPLLDDCPDRFVGERVAWLDPGSDHVCVVLRPVAVHVDPGRAADDVLWFSSVSDIEAGHAAEERQRPSSADEPGGG
jgi:flavin reductase (DIM6/NTAB) family NADH-FMN oxidoreductase RutF